MENSVDFMDNPEFVENIQEYLDNPEDFDDNPGIGGLVSNQGPFGREQLMGYLAAAGGVAFGLIVADFVDRFVATRRPRDSEGTTPGQMVKGLNPWYGRNAAAAIRMRPDAMRLGVQALGAIGSMAAAYFTRNVRIVPWLLGGAAIGFGSNLMKQLVDWYLMPFLFKVDKPDEVSLANRLYSLEQPAVQDEISRLFTNWAQVPNLSAQQLDPIPAGAIQSPLTIGKGQLPAAGQSAIALAGTPQRDPQPQPLVAAGNRGVGHANGQRQKMATGRLGMCSSCGGGGGGGANGWCWSDCPDLCSSCGEQMAAADMCRIVVQDGWPVTLLNGLITATGANPADVARANSWADLNAVATAWRPGAEIVLPNVVCMAIHRAKARGLSNEQAILSVAEGFNTGNGAQPFMVSPAVAGLAPPMVGAVPEREREPEPVRANTAPAAPAAVAGPPAEAPAPAPTPKYDPVEERMARFELRPD